MPTAMSHKLRESSTSAFREGSGSGSKREVVIIEAGWGSSAYYSEEVLERDIPRIFPIGTKMYLNHPTRREDTERPERDVRDLVGKIVETPRMAGIQSVAVAEIFEHWVPVIDALAKDIGLSIRALGVTEDRDIGGKHGPYATALTEGFSVDFVTEAGAGGSIGELVESARERNSEPVREALDSELHQNLEKAGEERFGSKEPYTYCYVGDIELDKNWVVYRVRPSGEEYTYYKMKFLRNTDGDVELQGDPVEVERETSWITAEEDTDDTPLMEAAIEEAEENPISVEEAEAYFNEFLERDVSKDERVKLAKKGQAIPIKDKDGNIIGGRFPMANCEDVKAAAMSVGRSKQANIKAFIKRVASKLSCPVPFKESGSGRGTQGGRMADGSELSELKESFQQFKKDTEHRLDEADTKVKEADARADRAEDALRLSEAGKIVASVVGEIKGLPQKAQTRAIESVLRQDLPTLSDGKLDESVLKERARTKAKEELEYLGDALGRGRVTGMGESSGGGSFAGNGNGGGEQESTDALTEAFQRLGMPETVAKLAAEGR